MRSVLLSLLLLLPAMASATDVKGTLSTPTVWTRSGSPYVLKGDVTVAWGVKLTLEPGARIIAASTDALRSGVDPERVELIVDGTLVVRGTRSRPVELTARGAPGSWYGIRVRGGRGTVIDGAVVTQARQGISLGMSAVVRNTSVSAIEQDCLHVSWGESTLEGNQLSGCGGNGSSVDPWTLARAQATASVARSGGSASQRTGWFEARVRGRAVFAHHPRGTRSGAVAHAFGRPPHRPEAWSALARTTPHPRTGGMADERVRWGLQQGSRLTHEAGVRSASADLARGVAWRLTEVETSSEEPIAGPERWTSPGRVRKKPGWPVEPPPVLVT
ncbi:hypothetical protein JRI60_34135 [Archangium violaceum]|uniref:right-handed parallel beta-helix repeat-containing protein n=1 Tax=Archangium violaceum TaxID=83451 RepID=UPI00194F154E|nr:right-handed parallel beta-helix repeat-containing protein [Archangium violaceum]QRN94160.1 hypothetical protein JRI60_34135 [Archangium violaceum]